MYRKYWKRLLDVFLVFVSFLGAMCLSPLWLPFLIAMQIQAPGSLFYKQTRVGRCGREFKLIKFRSMVMNADQIGPGLYGCPNDPRIPRAGRWLRRLAIDEIPQLWNVFKGQMSIVGPRPVLPMTATRYSEEYKEILTVKPGLTSLAVAIGRNALVRSQRIEMEKSYVQRCSFILDIKIIFETAIMLISGRGFQQDQSEADLEQ